MSKAAINPDGKDIDVLDIEESEDRLLNTGLLYAINALILNPLGYALVFCYDAESSTPEQPIMIGFIEHRERKPIKFRDHSGPRLLSRYLQSLVLGEGSLPENFDELRLLAEEETN